MADDGVTIRIEAEGGDEAAQELRNVAEAERQVERATKEAGGAADDATRQGRNRERQVRSQTDAEEKAARTTGRATGALDAQSVALGALVGGLSNAAFGVGDLTAMYDAWIERIQAANEHLKETASLVRENAEARLDLAALQGVEDPEEVEALDRLAAFSGRRPGEVARVATSVASKFPDATDAEREALLTEVAGAGQLTAAPLQDLLEPLAVLYRRTGDARQSGNILSEAIDQAGEGDPAKLGEEIKKFLGIGEQIGGLTTAQAAGFAAAGTSLGLPNEIATTGLKNVLFAIRGKGTPGGNAVLEREGIDRDDVELAIMQIAEARESGRISNAEFEELYGREGAPVGAVLGDPATARRFLAGVDEVEAASERSASQNREKAAGVFQPGSIQALNLQAKQGESRAESIRASSVSAAEQDAARAELAAELEGRIAGGTITPARAEQVREEFDALIAQGEDINDALRGAFATPSTATAFRGPISKRRTGVPLNAAAGARAMIEEDLGRVREAQGRLDPDEPADAVILRLRQGPQLEPGGFGAAGGDGFFEQFGTGIDNLTIIQNQTNYTGAGPEDLDSGRRDR